jgi:hypothetical protein
MVQISCDLLVAGKLEQCRLLKVFLRQGHCQKIDNDMILVRFVPHMQNNVVIKQIPRNSRPEMIRRGRAAEHGVNKSTTLYAWLRGCTSKPSTAGGTYYCNPVPTFCAQPPPHAYAHVFEAWGRVQAWGWTLKCDIKLHA